MAWPIEVSFVFAYLGIGLVPNWAEITTLNVVSLYSAFCIPLVRKNAIRTVKVLVMHSSLRVVFIFILIQEKDPIDFNGRFSYLRNTELGTLLRTKEALMASICHCINLIHVFLI